jgi:hypothetical protein
MVARYERRPVRNDDCPDDQAGSHDSVAVYRPSSSKGQPSWSHLGPGGKELVAFGRKPADHDQSAFQGIHALNPLILVDEACGVPKSIFDAVDALATNSNARVFRSATLTIPRRTSHTSASPDRAGM